MSPGKDLRAAGLALLIAACAGLVCVALISGSQLRPVAMLAKPAGVRASAKGAAPAGKARAQALSEGLSDGREGSFVLNYLRSNKDVGRPMAKHMHRLSLAQIQKEAGDNTDNLNMLIRPLRAAAVGPDGLSDQGDLADISLLAQLGGQNAQDAVTSDAVDMRHRVRRDTMSFGLRKAVHDMAHEAERIDEGAHYGSIGGGEGGDSFHVLAGSAAGNVDTLGTPRDSDVFKMVDSATASPSHQDVHLGALPAAEATALDSTRGDSEAEEMADPRRPDIVAERQQAAQDDKGVWVEPGSNKGYDSFALDSLQVKGEA